MGRLNRKDGEMKRKIKIKEAHAAARMMERYIGFDFGSNQSLNAGSDSIHFYQLRQVVNEGRFEFLRRQSGTRSICRAWVERCWVYFVMNRKLKSIVTVLSEEQAVSQMVG